MNDQWFRNSICFNGLYENDMIGGSMGASAGKALATLSAEVIAASISWGTQASSGAALTGWSMGASAGRALATLPAEVFAATSSWEALVWFT